MKTHIKYQIKEVVSAEKIRDGGSFAAKFITDNDVLIILYLPLNIDNKSNYLSPYIIIGHEVLIDEKELIDNNEREIVYVTWDNAKMILYDIFCHCAKINFFHFGWLQCMCFIAANDGHVPTS